MELDTSGLIPIEDAPSSIDVSGLIPIDDEGNAAPAKAKMPDMLSSLVQGIVQSGKDLGQLPAAVGKQKPEALQDEGAAAAPITLDDLKNMKFGDVGSKLAYGFGKSAPAMAGGVAGAIGGSALAGGPETPAGIAAGIAGTGIGAGAAGTLQTLGPLYAAEYEKSGDPDVAFEKALDKAKTEGLITGVAFSAFSFAPFKSGIKNLLLQATGVQPAIAEGGHAIQNLEEGKPALEGAGDSYIPAALGTVVPLAAHHIATKMMSKGAKAELPPEQEPVAEQEMPTSEQLLLEGPRGETIDVTPEGEASTKTERDALALRALPAPKQDSGVFIDHPEQGMVQLTQAQAELLRSRIKEMHDNGLTPDVMAAQRNRGTGTEPAADVKALPAPSVIPNVFIGGKEGLKPATTADIIAHPESGQITPQTYRYGKSGEALESEPVVGQGYNKITLPNGDNVAAIVTAIGKDGRAVITTDDGRKLRPLVSKTKFYQEPKTVEPTRQEFRPESPVPVDESGLFQPTQDAKPIADSVDAPAQNTKEPKNIFRWIADQGGISSSDPLVGDLRAMGLDKKFIPGKGKLINKNGLPLDELRKMAVRDGYLQDAAAESDTIQSTSSIPDLLNAISKQAQGKDVFSTKDINQALDAKEAKAHLLEAPEDIDYQTQYVEKQQAEQAAADEREYYASRDDATVRAKAEMYGLSFKDDAHVDDMNRAIADVEEGFKFQKSEPTDIGEQFIIDGTEKSAKQLAQAKEETNKGFVAPKAAQKPADIGLFKAADAREKAEREPTLFRTSEPTDKVRINFLKAMSANDAAIQKQLSDYVDKVYGKGVGAKLVDSLSSEGAGETTGAFSPKTKLAYIALNDSKGVRNLRDILNTTRHEVIHALRDSNAIPAKDWQILEQAAKQRWMKRYGIDKAYSNLKDGAKLEEAIAEAMADRQNIKEGPVIKRILESVAQFFGKIKNFFDKQEFRSSEDIFKDVESGKYAPAKAETEFNSRVQENAVSLTGLTPEEFTDQASVFLQRAKQSEKEPLKRLNDMNWWTRTMVTPRTIASMFKEATPLVDSAERMMERSSTIVNQLHDSMKPYFGMDVNAQKKLNRWFEYARIKGIEKYTGSVINDVKETKPYYDDKGEYHVPPTLSKNGEVITLNKEEANAANAVHSGFEKAADMWRDMTLEENGFTKQGDPRTYAELNAHMEASKAGRKGTTPKEVARLTQEVRKADYAMRGLEEASALRKGYVPFVRRGKFGVSVYDKQDRRLEFRRFDEKDAKKNMDELRSKYPLSQGYKINQPSEMANYQENIQPGFFGILDDISYMSGLNDEQHAALRDNLEKRMAQQGFRRHRIASDNIAGYSTDFHIAIPEYISGVSNYMSKRIYKPKMDKAVGEMTRKPNLHKWGQDYVSYVMSPQEEMQKVRYLASLYYLSTNPSSMIVNSTQPALVSLPYLSMFSHPLKAAGQMARAYKDVAAMIDGGQKGSMSGVINLDKAPADVKAELMALRDKGSLLPLQMDEFTANSKKEGPLSHPITNALSKYTGEPVAEALAKYLGEPVTKVTRRLTDMYGSVEQMNRLVTGIASMRLYKSDPKFAEKVSKIMEKDPLFAQEGAANSPADFANWVNKETHFRYGKINRPEMGRGKIGTTALQFRSFLQNTIELLYRMHGQGREGRLALLSVYLPITIAAAGIMGLPGSQDVLNMTQYAYNTFAKEKKDFKQELRETLTNLAPWMKGEVNGMPISYLLMNGLSPTLGTNISSRIGMNIGLNPNVKPQDGIEFLAGLTPITDAIVGTSLRAINLAKQGRNVEAAEAFLPSGFRNPLTALQWSKEGVRTGQGRLLRPAEDISAGELAVKAIGFTPAKNAVLGEELGAKGFAKTADTDYRSEVYGRLARTLADISKAPDVQSKQEAQEKYKGIINEIVDYNKTATKPITADQIRQSIRSRMGEEMMGAKGRKTPKPLQRRYQEIQESFGDDGEK